MLFKIAVIFLAAMLLVALVGRALFPGALRMGRNHPARPVACPACGRFQIGPCPCDCGGPKRKA